VSVVGYPDLPDRITEPGPKIEWEDNEWDAFARHLGLFQPESLSPVDSRGRGDTDILTDYRLRARGSFASDIGPIVDLGADGPTGHLGEGIVRSPANASRPRRAGRSPTSSDL